MSSESDQRPYLARVTGKTTKAELIIIANALNISNTSGNKPELKKRIDAYVAANSITIAADPYLSTLLMQCSSEHPGTRMKPMMQSIDKARKDHAEAEKEPILASGANKTLLDQGAKTDPPPQTCPLGANHPSKNLFGGNSHKVFSPSWRFNGLCNLLALSNDASSDEEEMELEKKTPPPSNPNNHADEDLTNTSVICVQIFDKAKACSAPALDELWVPIKAEDIEENPGDEGESIFHTKLSGLIPSMLKQGGTPMKVHGGRLSHEGVMDRATLMDLGPVASIESSRTLKLQIMDNHPLTRILTGPDSEIFGLELFWEGSSTRPKDISNIEPDNEKPDDKDPSDEIEVTDIAATPTAGGSKDKARLIKAAEWAIAKWDTKAANTASITVSSADHPFCEYLHKILGVEDRVLPWAETVAQNLTCYRVYIDSVKKLDDLKWGSQPNGGFLVPKNAQTEDGKPNPWAGTKFTKAIMGTALRITTSTYDLDKNLFGPKIIRHAPDAKAWVAQPTLHHRLTFQDMDKKKWLKYLKEAAKKASTKGSESSESEDEDSHKGKKKKKAKAASESSESEEEESRKKKKTKKQAHSPDSTKASSSPKKAHHRAEAVKPKKKKTSSEPTDSDHLDEE
ncbi:hypothetical protein C8J56DRAFT_1046177 [Mycena floridula]|nr:hypothetical protein C8J56DRAFT_1046177 [Mycena floridula]